MLVRMDVFLIALYFVILPVIGQLCRFLAHHPLLNPFLTAAMLLPVFRARVERTGPDRSVLNAFIAHLRQPEFDRLRLRARYGLNNPARAFPDQPHRFDKIPIGSG